MLLLLGPSWHKKYGSSEFGFESVAVSARVPHLQEAVDRDLVRLSCKVFLQSIAEERTFGVYARKQGHRGPELDIIRSSENLLNGPALKSDYQCGALAQPCPKQRVSQVS